MTTNEFLKGILEGKKTLLKLKDSSYINVPKYNELSVSNLYSKLIFLENMS